MSKDEDDESSNKEPASQKDSKESSSKDTGKNKSNKRGNGVSQEGANGSSDVIDFHKTLAQRDKARKEKKKQEDIWRKEYARRKKGSHNAPNYPPSSASMDKKSFLKPSSFGFSSSTEPFFNTQKIPLYTKIIILSFILVHLPLHLILDAGGRLEVFYLFGFISGQLTGRFEPSWISFLSPLSHIFIHGSWMHLVFNSVMMLVMGLFTEKTYGSRAMLSFFFLSALAGLLVHFAFNPFSIQPIIGASGGISGLFAITFLTLLKQGQLGSIGKKGELPIILFWIGLLTITGFLGGNVAWQAHLGGFLGGVCIYYARLKK